MTNGLDRRGLDCRKDPPELAGAELSRSRGDHVIPLPPKHVPLSRDGSRDPSMFDLGFPLRFHLRFGLGLRVRIRVRVQG